MMNECDNERTRESELLRLSLHRHRKSDTGSLTDGLCELVKRVIH